jgi:preprotein translocase subunit YajC
MSWADRASTVDSCGSRQLGRDHEGSTMSAVILPIAVIAMILLVYMPQQKQKKQLAALLASLSPGDAVLTTGGFYGVIVEVDGNDLFIEVAPGIELRILKSAVVRKVVEPSESTTESK